MRYVFKFNEGQADKWQGLTHLAVSLKVSGCDGVHRKVFRYIRDYF